jgi:hypothetical protein
MLGWFRSGTQGQMHVHSTPALNTNSKHLTRVDVGWTYTTDVVFIIHHYWTRLELDNGLKYCKFKIRIEMA